MSAVVETAVSANAVNPTNAATVSLTVGSQTDRVLITDLIVGTQAGFDNSTTSCTYGGTALTSLGVRHSNDGTAGFIQRFIMINPPTGTANLVGSYLNEPTFNTVIIAGVLLSGASQTGTDYTFTSAAGSTANPAVTQTTPAATSQVVFGACCGVALTAVDQTAQWVQNVNTQSAAGNARGASAAGTGSNVTCTWTAGADWWAAASTEIKTAAAQATPSPIVAPSTAVHRSHNW